MRTDGLFILLLTLAGIVACRQKEKTATHNNSEKLSDKFLVVLGIAQDAGYPQAGCEKDCCSAYYKGRKDKKFITCLALVDRKAGEYWLFEATPDIAVQLRAVQRYTGNKDLPEGILITHAHIGHYAGLMQLGIEAMGTKDVPVWVMPRMDSFLRSNGPWSQLVQFNNIKLQSLQADSSVQLSSSFKITPFRVPHRDEYSETVGFLIQSDKKKVLFIPDIDKWEKWDRSILAEIGKVDLALLDGTFYTNGELPGRDMKEIPHPFVEESLQQFSSLTSAEKSKIVFIHFNHTNPLLKKNSAEKEMVKRDGFAVAEEGMLIEL